METKQTRNYEKELNTPVEQRFKRWVYGLIRSVDGRRYRASDGTVYSMEPSGALERVSVKGTSQRLRRRIYGKMRRATGLSRSEFDRLNNLIQCGG
jgi:hypothetical protein